MNGQVRPLPRAINREKAQTQNAHVVQMSVCVAEQFARRLGGGVRRNRIEDRIVFTEWDFGVDTVNGRGRAEDKLFDLTISGQLQQIHGSVNIRFHVKLRLPKRWPHAGAGGEVDDTIELGFAEYLLERTAVADVRLETPEVRIGKMRVNVLSLNRWFIEVIEIVDDRDPPLAFSHQMIDKMRADEACTAGD